MPIRPTSGLVADALRGETALAAFNVITLEHAEAIAEGAERAGRPAVLQISHNAVRFHGRLDPIAAGTAAVAAASSASLSLHLDHVEDDELLHQAADHGFSSTMFDAGALPYADNVAATRAAAVWAHGHGVWLEAELGFVGGKPGSPTRAHAAGVRTDPHEARAYVEATGVDALAVAVGSSHAMTRRTAGLDIELIARIHDEVAVPLVLHGSSGVPDEQLRAAVRAGMTKINIGTALNVAYTGAVRETLADQADQARRDGKDPSPDPRRYIAPARAAMVDTVARLLTTLSN